jgi:lipopolysaccharide/colanic/teichoic acid biosynthesis glycosyltransferase
MDAEPYQAFPYMPPDASIREAYVDIFHLNMQVDERWSKLVFDKIFSMFALLFVIPIVCAIFASHLIISVFFPAQRGSLIVYYEAVSKGKIFRKYKFRTIKRQFINQDPALRGRWQAYAAEWNPESYTYLGVMLKALYLDELPQLFNILAGHMSVVGPRPLAIHHYERDLAQGNNFSKVVEGRPFWPLASVERHSSVRKLRAGI